MNFNNSNGPFYQTTSQPPKLPKRTKSIMIIALIAIFAIALLSTSWYTVTDKQQAVITTFGKFTETVGSGLHFKIPFGIQQATLVDVNVSLREEIGYRTDGTGSKSIPNESKMITGDFNIVNVDFLVEYRIIDAKKYLYASQHPREILKNITQAKIRDIISSYKVDDILTSKKAQIETEIRELILEELRIYDIGLDLTGIKIQDAEPPTADVIAAFKSVETAKQGRETAINEAKAYENKNIPQSEAERDKLIKNAEYLKQNRINEAKKQVAMFEAMFSQYKLSPNVNKQRMYYEAIEKILPGVKLYINTGNSSDTSMVLPLDDFAKNSGQ